jgi:hypothetical protein
MLDVEIRNFQSIEHVHLRVEGFTALVGRSNIGKSAIVRAVKAALTGAPEDNYVRHGLDCPRLTKGAKSCKCYCSVHLKTEGFDLLWEKGGDKNGYVFNGQTYTAANRGTPEFLEQTFGLVKVGDDKRLLQVADQFRSEGGGPIFLLDEYGSVVADVLSDVAQLDRINVATKLAEKDRRDCASQRKVREKDVMELKIKVTSYDGLDDVLARVRDIEAEEKKVEAQRARRDQAKRLKEALLVVGRQIVALRGVSTLVIPELEPVAKQHARERQVAGFIMSVDVRQAVITNLAGVETVSAPAIDPVHASWGRFSKLNGWVTKLRTYKDLFSRWKNVEEKPTPDIGGIQTSSKTTLRLGALRKQHTTLEVQVSSLEKQLAEAETEYEAIKAEEQELGACPTCAQPVTMTHDHAVE